jgi:cupin 2 domain-containing protein
LNNIVANIFNELPKFPQSKEIIDILVESNNIRIEKIVSTGQSSPDVFWYEQEENEFVLLLNGTAELEFEDKTIKMKAGDYLLIPSKQKHRVKSTSRTEHSVWLTVFYI